MSAKCNVCGANLTFLEGVFSSSIKLCTKCKVIKIEKINKYMNQLSEFGNDKYLSQEEEHILYELRVELNLNDEDLKITNKLYSNLRNSTKKIDIKMYEEFLVEAGDDKKLTDEEEAELDRIKQELKLSDDDIRYTASYYSYLKKITTIDAGMLPVLLTDLLLKKGEVCHFITRCKLMEEKNRIQYVGKRDGISFRIARGVNYSIGKSKGEKIVQTFNQVTDDGEFYITNKRVMFVGTKKNVTYPLNKIVDFTKYKDAVQFQKENESSPKYFIIDNELDIDEIGLLIFKLNEIQ